MQSVKKGHFKDPYRGDGWFVSFPVARGFLLFAVRPRNWHFYSCCLPHIPDTTRWYFGPFEIERSALAKESK
jgi:hypothetical protein